MTDERGGAAPSRIDRYEILGELGRGSMGIVYLAHDPNTDRRVALKRIVPPRAATAEEEAESRARFLLEARAAGRLHHPGIVTLYDADAETGSGLPFLVMEWVDGRSLAALLRERGALPWREAVRIATAVARALDHAHERGIVHRDVKPANVLLAADGAVKMSDFSIAKIATESHTLTGLVLGTPNYMSPEQVRGDPVDGRSDLFGLGAMLYEMLTGAPPFKGDSIASISYKLVHAEPNRLGEGGREIPAALEEVARRALAKDPAQRFQTGRELADALDHASRLAESAPEASAAPAPPPAAGATAPTLAVAGRRRPVAVRLALAGLALAGIAGLGYWLAHAGPAETPSPRGTTPVASARVPAAAPPAPAAAPEAVASAPGETAARATLRVVFVNRLRRGSIGVWVDGERVWSSSLEAPRGLFERIGGEWIRTSIAVAPGAHTVEVHVSQRAARIESRGSLRADFASGHTRTLRVTLVPYVTRLQLEWEP